jgi:plastocyanin
MNPLRKFSCANGAKSALAAVLIAVSAGYSTGVRAEPKVHAIVIEAMKFSPAVLEVNAGDTVVWTNKDLFPHDAVANDSSFASTEMEQGQSWEYKASSKGVFPYICSLHPMMTATLIVK